MNQVPLDRLPIDEPHLFQGGHLGLVALEPFLVVPNRADVIGVKLLVNVLDYLDLSTMRGVWTGWRAGAGEWADTVMPTRQSVSLKRYSGRTRKPPQSYAKKPHVWSIYFPRATASP